MCVFAVMPKVPVDGKVDPMFAVYHKDYGWWMKMIEDVELMKIMFN